MVFNLVLKSKLTFVFLIFVVVYFNVVLHQDLSVDHLQVRELSCINIIIIIKLKLSSSVSYNM